MANKIFTIGVMVEFEKAEDAKRLPTGFSGFILNVEAHEDEGYNAIYSATASVSAYLRTNNIYGAILTASDLTP